jgi:hypothetical protein
MTIIDKVAKYKITNTTKFDSLTFSENGLILKYRKKQEINISFSELDKIYIKISKLNPVFELGFIVLPFLIIYLSAQYVSIEKVMFLGLSTVIPIFIKINNYKSYSLIICLKEGSIFKKKVFLNKKEETVSIINAIRKEQLNHYTKTNTSHKFEPVEICQNLAS